MTMRLTKTNNLLFLTNPVDTYVGKSIEVYGEWSYGEIELLNQILKSNNNIIEIGANIGSHTVFLAKDICSQGIVYAFEPRRAIFQTLCANLALNSINNVFAYQKAIGFKKETIYEGSISMTQQSNQGAFSLGGIPGNTEFIEIEPLDLMQDFIEKIAVIKADVEGNEENVLRGAQSLIKRDRPYLYLENDRIDKSESLIKYAWEIGYDLYWHIVPLFRPNNFANTSANIFGGVCSFNMLGIPVESKMEISGGQKITDAETHPFKKR